MRNLLRSWSCLALVMLLSVSCVHVPLGTMWDMRSFGQDDLFELDPRQIGVKIRLDSPYSVKAAETDMILSAETIDEVFKFDFDLVDAGSQLIPGEEGWLSITPDRSEFEMHLSPEGIAAFESAQALLREQQGQLKSVSFSVNTHFQDVPEGTAELTASILLRFSWETGYFTLIDEAPFAMGDWDGE